MLLESPRVTPALLKKNFGNFQRPSIKLDQSGSRDRLGLLLLGLLLRRFTNR